MPTPPANGQKSKYDIFISYRREGGDATALFLREKLMQRGLRVFLDIIDLHKGYFDDALLGCIAEAPNFLVILSVGSLDRCSHPSDWLRAEIAHAIRTHRNIIPVLARGFTFPLELPEDIGTLPRHQGVEYSHMYHAAMVDSIMASVEEERAAAESATTENQENERREAERKEAERKETELREAERKEAERREAERKETERAIALSPAPPTPASASESQGRVLDAAMAAEIPTGKPAELIAMIRLSHSSGLKAMLKIEESDARPEDVRSKPFELEFPVDAQGRMGAAEVTMQINAPDFDPPLQRKVLRVPPKADSETYSFLLTPKFAGDLCISLELCRGEVCLASRLLRTSGTSSGREVSTASVLVSLPIEVKAFRGAKISEQQPAPTLSAAIPPPVVRQPTPRSPMPPSSPPPTSHSVGSSASGYSPAPVSQPPPQDRPPRPGPAAGSSARPLSSAMAGVLGWGEDSGVPLARFLGVERGNFDRPRALAFALAWFAATLLGRLMTEQFLKSPGDLSSWFFWLLTRAVEVFAILGSLWFCRKLLWASLASGLAAGIGFFLVYAMQASVGRSSPRFLFVVTFEIAAFVWALGWFARRESFRWPMLLLATYVAFLLGTFLSGTAIELMGYSSSVAYQLVRPLGGFIGPLVFTGVFQFITTMRKKSSGTHG